MSRTVVTPGNRKLRLSLAQTDKIHERVESKPGTTHINIQSNSFIQCKKFNRILEKRSRI